MELRDLKRYPRLRRVKRSPHPVTGCSLRVTLMIVALLVVGVLIVQRQRAFRNTVDDVVDSVQTQVAPPPAPTAGRRKIF